MTSFLVAILLVWLTLSIGSMVVICLTRDRQNKFLEYNLLVWILTFAVPLIYADGFLNLFRKKRRPSGERDRVLFSRDNDLDPNR